MSLHGHESDRDGELLETVAMLAASLTRRIDRLSREAFLADQDEIDLAAFRVGHLGQACRKLSVEFKRRHPDVAWDQWWSMEEIMEGPPAGPGSAQLWDFLEGELAKLEAIVR